MTPEQHRAWDDDLKALAASEARNAELTAALEAADEMAATTKSAIYVSLCVDGCNHMPCQVLRTINQYQRARAALSRQPAGGGKAYNCQREVERP